MPQKLRLSTTIGPVLILCIGAVTMASAQSASPFASKKKKQAWETAPAPQTAPPPTYSHQAQPQAQPRAKHHSYSVAEPGSVTSHYDYSAPKASQFTVPPQQAPASGAYYPGRQNGGQAPAQNVYQYESAQPSVNVTSQPTQNWGGYAPSPLRTQPNAQNYQASPYGAAQAPQSGPYYGQTAQAQPPKKSWKNRFGFGRFTALFSGGAKVGAAAVDRDGWSEEFIADADANVEISTVTQGGLEYGVNLGARAQYDPFRRGFGGRLPDCPPSNVNCASVMVAGVPTALRGHTSQFYTFGPDTAKDGQVALESAYIFLRSAYGDVTVGRDDGAAYLFSLGAPSLLAIGASNSPVDYTGLDSVKTVNDASGFAEKVTYTSPRLLGDTVGVGVQLGASYAPNARACGVDYCVKRNDASGSITPDLQDIMEVGIALDRTFDNGLKVEATGTYARGSEDSGIAGFDDLSAYNAGVEITYDQWTLGGSWLQSNNGLEDGDYTAWDTGLTWKPSRLGFTLGYGQAIDDSVRLKSNQAVFGATYDFDKFTLGTGVQYIERKTANFDGATVDIREEDALALFVEGGFKF